MIPEGNIGECDGAAHPGQRCIGRKTGKPGVVGDSFASPFRPFLPTLPMFLLRKLITLIVFVSVGMAAIASSPLPTRVDLQERYGVDQETGSLAVGELFGGPKAVEKKFPAWTRHWLSMGKDMEELMGMSLLVCAWNDAVAQQVERPGPVFELNVPAGQYDLDHVLYVTDGVYRGQSAQGTQLHVDLSRWAGPAVMVEVWPGTVAPHQVELSDLSLSVPTAQPQRFLGIHVKGVGAEVHIHRLDASGFKGAAIEIWGASASRVEDVALTDNSIGISLRGCTGPGHVARRITGANNGIWFRGGAWDGREAANEWHIGAVDGIGTAGGGGGKLLAARGMVNVWFDEVRIAGTASGPWIRVDKALAGSRIRGTSVSLAGGALLSDVEGGRDYDVPADAGAFSFCWEPGAPADERLPATCGGEEENAGAMEGSLKAGGASISIGAESGPALNDVHWGYNLSGLFSTCSGSDTALHGRMQELAPKVIRFPGGTLANFYHPTGNGYGIRPNEMALVAGTAVHENISSTYQTEQALIAEGMIQGNHLAQLIALATATNSSVLFVANLLTGTVDEMVSTIQAMRNAGVHVWGVELGNEAHLQAYNFRFGSVENYLAVAAPYANAIMANFLGMKIGLDGFPPGIIKDAGPAGTQRALLWNQACSAAGFGDALIIHCYSRAPSCNQNAAQTSFKCAADYSRSYACEKLPVALDELASMGNKKIWITEWNIDGGYNHYGNSMAQALFYADMSLTMAGQPKVDVSAYHQFLAVQDGYNLVKKRGGAIEPQINYWSSLLFEDLYKAGNLPQEVAISGHEGLRGFAFLAADGRQHLYLINRSGNAMNLSSFVGDAGNISYTVLGSQNIVAGTGGNSVNASANVMPVSGTADNMGMVQLPGYAAAHLSWAPVPPQGQVVWKTTFGGADGCRLKAMVGTDVVQPLTARCANVSGGNISTWAKSAFPSTITASKVVLVGVTFHDVGVGKWINSRMRFQGQPGRIKDAATGQVLADVSPGVRYDELTLDLGQPVLLESLLGRGNMGQNTALMTVEAMRLVQ